VPRRLWLKKIRRNTPLILLLDGLDEVPEDARASCLKAIGEYGAEASRRFVVSSRIAEYAATQDAPVYLEVEVQPLTPQQVIDNLTAYVFHQPEAKPLLNALQTDPLLREAVANPFYLNTAQLLFATGRKYSDFGFAATDVAGLQRELVERFVEYALERKAKRDYAKEKVRKWLSFLAGKMEESNRKIFDLLDLTHWSGWHYNPLVSQKPPKSGCCIGFLLVIIILANFSAMILFSIFRKQFIMDIGQFLNFLTLMLAFLLSTTRSSKVLRENIIYIDSPYQHIIGPFLLVHVYFRIRYHRTDTLPLRLVTFLNEMSLRHLLEFDGDPMTGKGGGSWRWRHRIIQEYF